MATTAEPMTLPVACVYLSVRVPNRWSVFARGDRFRGHIYQYTSKRDLPIFKAEVGRRYWAWFTSFEDAVEAIEGYHREHMGLKESVG